LSTSAKKEEGENLLIIEKYLKVYFTSLEQAVSGRPFPQNLKGSNIHRYFQLWEQAGFFEAIWAYALEEYDDLHGLDWEWQSLDGCITKAPLAQESVGKNPTDRGKKRYQTQLVNRGAWASHRDCSVWCKHA
jgi:hypothetical protein